MVKNKISPSPAMSREYYIHLCKCTFAANVYFGVKGYFIMQSVPRLCSIEWWDNEWWNWKEAVMV
jgi:hypothetical protein